MEQPFSEPRIVSQVQFLDPINYGADSNIMGIYPIVVV